MKILGLWNNKSNGTLKNQYFAWNVDKMPRPIRASISSLVFLNKMDAFAQATLLKSPVTTTGMLVFLTRLATLSRSPSRSLELASSVGLGGGGCTPKNRNRCPL